MKMENISLDNVTTSSLLKVHVIPQWTSYTLISSMILIAVIGITGNAIVLAVIKNLREKNSTDYFVFSMSLIDFYSAVVNTVCYVFYYEPTIWKSLSSVIFCRLHVFSIGFTNITTTLLLAATAYDRYRRTSNNSTKDSLSAASTAKRVSIGILASGLSYSLFYIFTTSYKSTTQTCRRDENYNLIATIFSAIMGLVFVSMFTVVIVCYSKVAVLLHRHHKSIMKAKKYSVEKNQARKNTQQNKGTRCNLQIRNEHLPNSAEEFQSSEVSQKAGSNKTICTERRQSLESCIIEVTSENNKNSKDMVYIADACQKKQIQSKMSKKKQILASVGDAKEKRSRQMVNRTTLMMFLISLVYVSSWVINWTASIYAYVTDSKSSSAVIITEKIFMINCMTNPVFYIIMSSKFRQKAKEILWLSFPCNKGLPM